MRLNWKDWTARSGRAAVAALVLGVLPGITAWSDVAAQPVEIRVGYGATPATMLGLAFEKTDIMKHYGKSYTVKRQAFPASSQQIQAFAANQLDVGFLAYPSFAFAILNANAKITIWGGGLQECVPGYYTQTWAVRKDSDIHRVSDLKGKRIATPAFGTGNDGGLRIFLKSQNLDPKRDVTIVEVNWPNQDAMLRQGRVDAAVYLANAWHPALKRGDIRPLFDFCSATGFVQTLVQVVRTEFLQTNRAAMQDFAEDFVRSVRWFRDPKNHAQAVRVLAAFAKQPEKNFSDWAFTKKDQAFAEWGMPDMQAFQRNIDQFHEVGLLPKSVKASNYTDLSLVIEARRRIEK